MPPTSRKPKQTRMWWCRKCGQGNEPRCYVASVGPSRPPEHCGTPMRRLVEADDPIRPVRVRERVEVCE